MTAHEDAAHEDAIGQLHHVTELLALLLLYGGPPPWWRVVLTDALQSMTTAYELLEAPEPKRYPPDLQIAIVTGYEERWRGGKERTPYAFHLN